MNEYVGKISLQTSKSTKVKVKPFYSAPES